MKQSKKIIPIPIHFKKPGRSYSQIGRKGNVALYSVYSDYFCVPGFALPFLLIGYELVCIKTMQNGQERYPHDWEFGHSAWSIPKSFSQPCRIPSRLRKPDRGQLRIFKRSSLHNRSATSEESADVAQVEFGVLAQAA